MTAPSLGQRLRANNERVAAAEASQRDAARQAQADAERRAHLAITRFFEGARVHFTASIEQGLSARDLSIPVGSPTSFDETIDSPSQTNQDIFELLRAAGDTSPGLKPEHLPVALGPGGTYRKQWEDFVAWATSEGLCPSWYEQHLGEDGFHSQLYLSVGAEAQR